MLGDVLGADPFEIADEDDAPATLAGGIVSVGLRLVSALVPVAKGKHRMALFGVFIRRSRSSRRSCWHVRRPGEPGAGTDRRRRSEPPPGPPATTPAGDRWTRWDAVSPWGSGRRPGSTCRC